MAKIAFFSEKLPPSSDRIGGFAYDLMRGLADLQHDVQVYSTYEEPTTQSTSQMTSRAQLSHPRIEIIYPFRDWTWQEVPRATSVLMEFRPDVLHFIQPHAEALTGMTNAMTLLANMKPVIGSPIVVTSFFDLNPSTIRNHSILFRSSDALTVINDSQRTLVERIRTGRDDVFILPLSGMSTELLGDETVSPTIRDFFATWSRVIFVPGDVALHHEPEILFDVLADTILQISDAAVVFGGDWGDIPRSRRRDLMQHFTSRELGARILLTGPIANEAERFCLHRSQAVFTASLPQESLELPRILRRALSLGVVPVMSDEQAAKDSIPWRDRHSAYLVGLSAQTWGGSLSDALLNSEPAAAVRTRLLEMARQEVFDRPANILSRIYSQMLAQRGK